MINNSKIQKISEEDLYSAYTIITELYENIEDRNTPGKIKAIIQREFNLYCTLEQAEYIINKFTRVGDTQVLKNLKNYGY